MKREGPYCGSIGPGAPNHPHDERTRRQFLLGEQRTRRDQAAVEKFRLQRSQYMVEPFGSKAADVVVLERIRHPAQAAMIGALDKNPPDLEAGRLALGDLD